MSSWLKRIIILIWVALFIGIGSFTTLIYMVKNNFNGYFGEMPGIEFIENPSSSLASELYSADGILIGKYFRKNRTNVDYEEISPNLINALIATEDSRFEKHSGIDFIALMRVAFGVITFNHNGGGSTVSQQLAKNIFAMRDDAKFKGKAYNNKIMKSFTIKIKEWIISARLEKSYTKQEIITMYFNTVDYGSNSFGIKAAAKTFFGVDPIDLKLEEAAVLVGVLKAPSFYSPILNPENSKRRRDVVLYQLYNYDYITEEMKDSLQGLPLALNFGVEDHVGGLAPYFRTIVKNQTLIWCKKNGYDLFEDGLKIYTTINTKLQEKAERAVAKHMKILQQRFFEHWKGHGNPWREENGKEMVDYDKIVVQRSEIYRSLKKRFGNNSDSIEYYLNKPKPMIVFSWKGDTSVVFSSMDSIRYYMAFLHAGMASIDPSTGHIKAWVGGINYKYFQYDHVKTGARQPGSTFKPFIYLAALDNGMSPCDTLLDDIVTFTVDQEVDGKIVPVAWQPPNYENTYTQKYYTLRHALAASKNVIAAKVMKQIGPQEAVNYAKKCGITSPLEAVPSLCLGVNDVTLLEMLGAYSTFVNDGVWNEPLFITRIEDKNGNLLVEFNPVTKQVISKESAQIMCYMLQGATSWDYGVDGTAIRLRTKNANELGGERWDFTNQIGAKTGTTNNASDGWFMGITPDLVTGIWVGADNRNVHFRGGSLSQGSRLAMPVFGHYMKEVYADSSTKITTRPFSPEVERLGKEACSKKKKGTFSSDTTKTGSNPIYFKNNNKTGVDDI